MLAALNGSGFDVRSCAIGASLQHPAELRVLQADAFDGPDALHGEYLADPRPTLVLTQSDEQELAVLPFLSEHDELARFTERADLLGRRLSRLSLRAGHAERAAPPHTDPLTGLANRARFDAELEPLLASPEAGQAMALMYLDLDHFEQVNERHDRWGGDLALVQLSMLLSGELAPADKLARLGADKFACLLSRYDRATLLLDAKRLVRSIAEQQFIIDARPADDGQPADLKLTASAGLSFLVPGMPAAELWRQVDMALFDAKSKGRNRLCVYAEPSGIRPLGSTPEAQARTQHFLNVTQVVSERVEQLLKAPDACGADAVSLGRLEDPLTQLNNRQYFDLRLEREFDLARKHGRTLSIAWIDISGLHEINRRHGWIAGDMALKVFAEQARGSIRLVDWLARCGGQEFCLVMPDTDLHEGQAVADRILARMAACSLTSADGSKVAVGLAVGMAQSDDAMQRVDQLIAGAVDALQRSKSGSIQA